MTKLFLITLLVMMLAIVGMAIGTLFGRRGITGSCGGLNRLGGSVANCPVCSGRCERRDDARG